MSSQFGGLAEQLIARAIEQPSFRRVIVPADLGLPTLTDRLSETRDALVSYLSELDLSTMAGLVRGAAMTELDYTT
ncbi:hypothetical protein ACIQ6Y_14335 [Streptomyces sp. NPDC096205]|uniref:hypothetical protein n=1 Tax=Streptomyces sp. NPDC096205 TaxID=3366081 RepID=UPI0037F3FADA